MVGEQEHESNEREPPPRPKRTFGNLNPASEGWHIGRWLSKHKFNSGYHAKLPYSCTWSDARIHFRGKGCCPACNKRSDLRKN